MNFALLGDDRAVLPLVGAIAAHPEHALVQAALVGDAALTAALSVSPPLRVAGSWEVWLAGSDVDVVIVAGSDDGVLEAARRLAASGLSLLILPAAGQGLAFVYELTLIRDDARIALCPGFMQRFEPAVTSLKTLIDAGALGRLMHLQLDRTRPPVSRGAAAAQLSQADIDGALLGDVDLLRHVGGAYNQVTAIYTGGAGGGLASMAQVTLAGEGLPDASWSLKAAQSGPWWKLTVIGEQGTVVLSRDKADDPLRVATDDVGLSAEPAAAPAADRLLELCAALKSGVAASPDWSDFTHAFELVDAARRSVKRRRTIDVYFEAASERSTFKTQMTAVGCGLLVVTFLAVLVLLLIGALFEPGKVVMQILRGLVFLPLFLFLLLQVLLFITRASAGDAGAAVESKDD